MKAMPTICQHYPLASPPIAILGSGRGSKPRRRAQLRFLEQKRKRSTTERPNLEQLMMMRYDSIDKESHDNGQTEGHKHEGSDKEQTSALRDNDGHAIIACDVGNVCQGEEPVPTVTISSNRDSSDKCPSPEASPKGTTSEEVDRGAAKEETLNSSKT